MIQFHDPLIAIDREELHALVSDLANAVQALSGQLEWSTQHHLAAFPADWEFALRQVQAAVTAFAVLRVTR